MKERPILFSGPMIRALLDGRKTQTRRIVKPSQVQRDARTIRWENQTAEEILHSFRCPYGVPGDRLWVKSTHWHKPASDLCPERVWHPDSGVLCSRDHSGIWEDRKATETQTMDIGGFRKRPSIHMPRWASRITLEVTEVRVQRVQDISEEDAVAEGVETHAQHYGLPEKTLHGSTPWYRYDGFACAAASAHQSFQSLWASIHGPGSWDANPWVWAVSFKPLAGRGEGE